MEFKHVPVMPDECLKGLSIKKGGIIADGTTGGGGHSKLILESLNGSGRLICIDRDSEALESAKLYLKNLKNVSFVRENFSEITKILKELKIDGLDGMLLDLGVSSYQIDNSERGFSYMHDGPLDMRMNREDGLLAADIVNSFSREEIIKILRDFGEEEFANNIVKNILTERAKAKITTTGKLREIIEMSIPAAVKFKRGNPCKKTFQALRIAVNSELSSAEKGIRDGFNALKAGGRLAVITFHSLEDRMVKNLFNEFAEGCTCIEYSPVCVCGKKPRGKIITKKPIEATEEEIKNNSRSKSAKLRIIEKM